jgi:hypothetical protein
MGANRTHSPLSSAATPAANGARITTRITKLQDASNNTHSTASRIPEINAPQAELLDGSQPSQIRLPCHTALPWGKIHTKKSPSRPMRLKESNGKNV